MDSIQKVKQFIQEVGEWELIPVVNNMNEQLWVGL